MNRTLSLLLPAASLCGMGLTAPLFNYNYAQQAHSANGVYTVESVPHHCTNSTAACIRVTDKAGTEKYSFLKKSASGYVFWVSNDGQDILGLPAEIGFPPVEQPRMMSEYGEDARVTYILHYRNGILTDSLPTPEIRLTKANRSYIYAPLKRKLDLHRVIQVRGDSVALITCRGNVALSCRSGLLGQRALSGFGFLKRFRSFKFQAHNDCRSTNDNAFSNCQSAFATQK